MSDAAMTNSAIAARIVNETTTQSGKIFRFKLCISDGYALRGAIEACSPLSFVAYRVPVHRNALKSDTGPTGSADAATRRDGQETFR